MSIAPPIIRPDAAELELDELERYLASIGAPRFHARQIFQWLYRRGETNFEAMTDLGRDLRTQLASVLTFSTPAVVKRERSDDGTTKILLQLADGIHRSYGEALSSSIKITVAGAGTVAAPAAQ